METMKLQLIEELAELENCDLSWLEVTDVPSNLSETDLEDVPPLEFKTNADEEKVLHEKNESAWDDNNNNNHLFIQTAYEIPKQKQAKLENTVMGWLEVIDVPPHLSEAAPQVDLIVFTPNAEEEEVLHQKEGSNWDKQRLLELECSDLSWLEVTDVTSDLSEAVQEDALLLSDLPSNAEEERVLLPNKNGSSWDKQKLIELENLDLSWLEVTDVLPQLSDADLINNMPLLENTITEEEENILLENEGSAGDKQNLAELKDSDLSWLDIANVPSNLTDTASDENAPLMEFINNIEEENILPEDEGNAWNKQNLSWLDVADVPPDLAEASPKEDVPLIEFTSNVEEENIVPENNGSAWDKQNLSWLEVSDEPPDLIDAAPEVEAPLMEFTSNVEEQNTLPENNGSAWDRQNLSWLDVTDVPPDLTEASAQDDAPVMELKTNIEEENILPENNGSSWDKQKLAELENSDLSWLEVTDVPPDLLEAAPEYDVPLMELDTNIEEGLLLSKNKRRARHKQKLIELENSDLSWLEVSDVPPDLPQAYPKDDIPVLGLNTNTEEENVLPNEKRSNRDKQKQAELENTDLSWLEVTDVPPDLLEAAPEYDVPLMELDINTEEVNELPKKKRRDRDKQKLAELENSDLSWLEVTDVPPDLLEAAPEYDVPLMELDINTEEVNELPKKKRRDRDKQKLAELEKSDLSLLKATDVPPKLSEAAPEDDVQIIELDTDVEEENEEPKKKARDRDKQKLTELKKTDLRLKATDVPPKLSEAAPEDDVQIIELDTDVEEENEVPKKKARDMDKQKLAKLENSNNHLSEAAPEDDVQIIELDTDVEEEHEVPTKRRDGDKQKLTELEKSDLSWLKATDVPPKLSEAAPEDDVQIIELDTDIEEENEEPKKKRRDRDKQKLADLDNTNLSWLDVTDVPARVSEAAFQYDEFLIELDTNMEEAILLPKKKGGVWDKQKLAQLENSDLSWLEVPPRLFDAAPKDDVPLMELDTNLKGDILLLKKKASAWDKKKLLGLGNSDLSWLKVTDVPPDLFEATPQNHAPLTKLKTNMEEENVLPKKKRSNRDKQWATGVKKRKDAVKTEEKINEKSVSKVIQATQKPTFERGTSLKEPYKCDQLSFNRIKKNIQDDSSEKPNKCDICERSFKQKGHLREHYRLHTGEKPFKCDVCQRGFNKNSHLTEHKRTHTGENPFKCDVCQRSFIEKGNFIRHLRLHTGEKPYQCNVCTRRFTDMGNLSNHMRSHTGEKPYKCEICDGAFTQRCHLTKHLLIHAGNKPFKCNVCDCSFSQKSNLTQHMRSHTGEKPYKCDVCHRSFSQKGHLSQHARIHTSDKPYKCDICQRYFNIQGNLLRHMRHHTGEDPHKCEICPRSFNEKVHLIRHMRKHTGEKPYKCHLCQSSFSEKSNLTKHILLHAGNIPFECDLCERRFTQKASLARHILLHANEITY